MIVSVNESRLGVYFFRFIDLIALCASESVTYDSALAPGPRSGRRPRQATKALPRFPATPSPRDGAATPTSV
jgi:hypothetical protein